MERRSFISSLAVGWAAFTGAIVTGAGALNRFMYPNVLYEPPLVIRAGKPDEYEVGKVDERFKDSDGIWIIRDDDGIYALISTCTHLGCTPNWFASDQKFKCPCHGSGFRKSGVNYEGPAPRPLERAKIVLDENGEIVVDKGTKFLYEKGQWDDPDAKLRVV